MFSKDGVPNNSGDGELPSSNKSGPNENDIIRSQIMKQAQKRNASSHLKAKSGIAGEEGMNQLGFRDGKVDCSYCWTVKRDIFDMPMLIVMNVSSYTCLID